MQVQITQSEKVLLHAVEENAEGQPIDRDTASCLWSTDRTDLVTLEAGVGPDGVSADSFAVYAAAVGGGVAGDAVVTATVTEPDVDNGDGTTTPGAVYVGTQVVTVSQDETIASVEVTADAPIPK